MFRKAVAVAVGSGILLLGQVMPAQAATTTPTPVPVPVASARSEQQVVFQKCLAVLRQEKRGQAASERYCRAFVLKVMAGRRQAQAAVPVPGLPRFTG